mmetsp:Transcript_827/g.1033  ORF Transcript_827/g.1033 Transcript_827/m.1033 type:complete len:213 (-) Transcript_827:75-713(-)
MQAPMQPIYYNGGMGGTDFFDRLKQQMFASMLKNIIARTWPLKLDLGLMDMAVANSYIIFKYHHPTTTHREFMKMLVHEFFLMALGKPLADPPRRSTTPRTPASSSRSLPIQLSPTSQLKVKLAPKLDTKQCIPGMFKGNKYYRNCKSCFLEGIYLPSEIPRPNGKERRNYPRSKYGCKTCNVALCSGGECWEIYHNKWMGNNDLTGQERWV